MIVTPLIKGKMSSKIMHTIMKTNEESSYLNTARKDNLRAPGTRKGSLSGEPLFVLATE